MVTTKRKGKRLRGGASDVDKAPVSNAEPQAEAVVHEAPSLGLAGASGTRGDKAWDTAPGMCLLRFDESFSY